ncbi:hypothetical protein PQX77_011928 [Marasmius sp. AFHP31]|nr:hypothetical protein PQX77_011928 [Marasmius sp. AFHP31]
MAPRSLASTLWKPLYPECRRSMSFYERVYARVALDGSNTDSRGRHTQPLGFSLPSNLDDLNDLLDIL